MNEQWQGHRVFRLTMRQVKKVVERKPSLTDAERAIAKQSEIDDMPF